MSLQVWLPLNGNLNNQGLSGDAIISGTPSYSSSGKIGNGCLNTSNMISIYEPSIEDKKICSFAFWAYITGSSITSDWTLVARICDKGTNSGSHLRFEVCPPSRYNGIYCFSNHNNDRYAITSGVITSKSGGYYDQWVHFCFTSDGTTLTRYMNGVKEGTCTYDGPGYFSGYFDLTSNDKCFKQDVRIYDHCLSAKEVKEISKGLICHYKLDNNGFGNPNFITTMSSGGRTTLNGKYGLNADFSQNSDTYGYFNVSPALELDTTYTLSFDVSNFPKGGSWNFMLWNNANYDVGTITKDGHYTYTFVPSTSKLPSGYSLTQFLFDDGGRTNPTGMVYFTNFKIEKGSIATPWCPHTSDSMYTLLGLNSTTESDCSGYKNDGTISGSGNCENNSPRYSCSFTTNSTGKISSSSGFPIGTHPVFTVNFWFKSNEGTFSQWNDVFNIRGNHQIRLETVNTSGSYFQWFNYPLGTSSGFGEFTVSKNVWYMITLISDGSKFYCYKDASLYDTTTLTGTEWTTTGAFTIGDSSGIHVSISDFRIYSTALSASDIKELYNTSASVDKNGNMYAYEFKEE